MKQLLDKFTYRGLEIYRSQFSSWPAGISTMMISDNDMQEICERAFNTIAFGCNWRGKRGSETEKDYVERLYRTFNEINKTDELDDWEDIQDNEVRVLEELLLEFNARYYEDMSEEEFEQEETEYEIVQNWSY